MKRIGHPSPSRVISDSTRVGSRASPREACHSQVTPTSVSHTGSPRHARLPRSRQTPAASQRPIPPSLPIVLSRHAHAQLPTLGGPSRSPTPGQHRTLHTPRAARNPPRHVYPLCPPRPPLQHPHPSPRLSSYAPSTRATDPIPAPATPHGRPAHTNTTSRSFRPSSTDLSHFQLRCRRRRS